MDTRSYGVPFFLKYNDIFFCFQSIVITNVLNLKSFLIQRRQRIAVQGKLLCPFLHAGDDLQPCPVPAHPHVVLFHDISRVETVEEDAL